MAKSRCKNAGLLPRLTAAVYHNVVEEYYIYTKENSIIIYNIVYL